MRGIQGLPESYDAERADFARLLEAIRLAGEAPLATMRELDWIEQYVSLPGLTPLHPAEEIYQDQAHLMNASHQGMTQYPREFARWLRLLADRPLKTYLEIGCFTGHTACLAAAYLRRFHPEIRIITIDIWPWFLFERDVRGILPVEYRLGKTSFDVRDEHFDAVFIDGDHSFEWAWADYRNVGRGAGICGIHDISGVDFLKNRSLGGVATVWDIIVRDESDPGVEFHEFCDHPAGDCFGIGVRIAPQK